LKSYGVIKIGFLVHFWSRDFGTELCQMIAYNETLITTNFQIELIIGLRDVGGQSSQNSLKLVHTF